MGLRSLDDSREGIAKFIGRNPETSFCAVDGERLVGCILCGNDGRRGFIYHACVSPDYRKNGVGKHLVELALAALKKEGITKCALVCYSSNELGNGFWRSLGIDIVTNKVLSVSGTKIAPRTNYGRNRVQRHAGQLKKTISERKNCYETFTETA